MVRGQFKSLDSIVFELNIDLSLATYMRLSQSINLFLTRVQNLAPAVPIGVQTYIASFKKGSQGFRKIIGRNYTLAVKVTTIPSVITFKTLTGTGILETNEKIFKHFWISGTLVETLTQCENFFTNFALIN